MSVTSMDVLRTKIGNMTEEQMQKLAQDFSDAVEKTVKAIEDKLPYLILQQEANETSRLAQSIMRGGHNEQ